MKTSFADVVETYLADCHHDGIDPEKPFSGKITVRVQPILHQRVAVKAASLKKSITRCLISKSRQRRIIDMVSQVCQLVLVGHVSAAAPAVQSYEDGTYRGVYGEADNQVTIEVTLKANVVTKIAYRNLAYRGVNYRNSTDAGIVALTAQYQTLIDYLVGKDIRTSLVALYKPGTIVDGASGATIRSSKVISAIRDALNRGVYSY